MTVAARSVTIVIPTHDRYPKVRALLDSIRAHWQPVVDSVVVVDDSKNQVDLEAEFNDLHLRQIRLPERVFISAAKNIGWRAVSTEFVYFIDDDNVIDESTILPVLEVISESQKNSAVMPAVLYKTEPNLVWVYATPFLNSRLKQNLIGRNLPRNADLERRRLNTDALPNASLVRRSSLEDVGGFDERLVVNSSMNLALRLKARGWRVIAYTGAFIYHDVEPPGDFGWWARHGSADPERVRFELRDWFLISRSMHSHEELFTTRATFDSLRFLVPNTAAYLIRGPSRRRLLFSVARGYVEGVMAVRQKSTQAR